MGGTTTRGIALWGDNALTAQAERRTTPGSTGLVQSITEIVTELSQATTGNSPTEIGLGVPGLVDSQSGVVRHGHTGELGHFPLGLTQRECGCGQRGCIETSTSGWALARFNADRDSDGPLPDDFLKGLVALLRMTVLTTDPSSIVLGGGVVSNSRGLPGTTHACLSRTGQARDVPFPLADRRARQRRSDDERRSRGRSASPTRMVPRSLEGPRWLKL
ncbi:MAG: ROK family protein [Microbacterium sp.]